MEFIIEPCTQTVQRLSTSVSKHGKASTTVLGFVHRTPGTPWLFRAAQGMKFSAEALKEIAALVEKLNHN